MRQKVAKTRSGFDRTAEKDLWERYRICSQHSLDKRMIQQELVEKYQYLIRFVIRRTNLCPPRELDYDDLLSYGNMGLLDAIDRYNPSLGYAFQTYAASRIRGTILDELRRFDWISRTGREKIHALEKVSEQVLQETGEISNNKLREKLGMSEEQFREVLEIANRSYIGFLDEELVLEDSEVSKSSILTGEEPGPEEVTENLDEIEKLYQAMNDLTAREKKLIYLYYFKYWNFHDIAVEFGLSESRISQLHKRVLSKLKERLVQILEIAI